MLGFRLDFSTFYLQIGLTYQNHRRWSWGQAGWSLTCPTPSSSGVPRRAFRFSGNSKGLSLRQYAPIPFSQAFWSRLPWVPSFLGISWRQRGGTLGRWWSHCDLAVRRGFLKSIASCPIAFARRSCPKQRSFWVWWSWSGLLSRVYRLLIRPVWEVDCRGESTW